MEVSVCLSLVEDFSVLDTWISEREADLGEFEEQNSKKSDKNKWLKRQVCEKLLRKLNVCCFEGGQVFGGV